MKFRSMLIGILINFERGSNMKLSKNKTKYTVALLLVFAMLLQIAGPVIPQVFAESSNDDFRITHIEIEDGKVIVDWEFDFYFGGEYPIYEFNKEFALEKEKSGDIFLDDNILIGSYTASKDGKISVAINNNLETEIRETYGESESNYMLQQNIEDILNEFNGEQEEQPLKDENNGQERDETNQDEAVNNEGEGDNKQEVDLENGNDGNDDSADQDENIKDDPVKDEEVDEETEDKYDVGNEEKKQSSQDDENDIQEIEDPERDKNIGKATIGQIFLAAAVPNLADIFSGEADYITFSDSFEIEGVQSQPRGVEDDNFAQFITGVTIEHIDAEGNEIIGDFTKNSRLKIEYLYALPDNEEDNKFEIDTNQEFYITIPNEIEIIDDQIIRLYHKDHPGILLATVNVYKDNSAKVVFNENVNDPKYGYDRGGSFSITSVFGEIEVDDDGNGSIEFEVGQETKEIQVKFEKEVATVNLGLKKKGFYDKYNNEIVWTIDIEPSSTPAGIPITDLVITDTLLGDNHKLFEGSDYTINSDGVGEFSETDGKLIFTFNQPINTTPGEKYTITFRTKADISKFEENKTIKFKNQVEADYKVYNKSQPTIETDAEASVYVDYIAKSGKFIENETGDIADDRIEWTITVNSNYLTLKDVKIVDELHEGLELDEGSVVIEPEAPTGSSWKYEGNTLTYTFGETIDKPYTLTFKTKIIDLDAYKGNEQIKYPNGATITWDGGSETDGVKGEGIGVKTSLLEKRKGGEIDYTNHIVKWELVVNRNKIEIPGPIVRDTIPEGLKYVVGSFKVDGTAVTIGVSYNPETRELTYDFSGYKDNEDKINTMYTLYFETEVVDRDIYGSNDKTEFKNKAWLTSTDETIKDSYDEATQEYNSKVIDKSVEYDYTTYRATWTIKVNQNKMKINNARIVDIIDNDYKFIGEVKIDGVNADSDNYSFNEDTNTFTYNFPEEITGEHTISFVTEIRDPFEFFKGNGNKTIFNEAILYGDDVKDGSVADETSKSIGNMVVTKDGKFIKDDYRVDWEVIVNQNGVKIPGAVLEDTLPEGLTLDTSSVRLFKMNLNPNGGLTQDEEVDLTSANIEYDANTRVFVFKFNKTIEDAYKLKFSTDIDMEIGANKTYRNSITFKGSGVEEDHTSDAVEVKYTVSEGEAWGSSRGSITIIKVNEEGKKLQNAVFELLDADGNVIKVSSETDKDGLVVFRGLHFGIDYKLREKVAPESYAISSEVYKFTLDKESENQGHIEYEFINTKIKGNIQFTKYGEANDFVAGAEFTLYNADDEEFVNPIKTAVSGEDGKVTFENIAFGSYKIKETKAPKGYLPTDVVLEVTISEDGKTVEATPNSIVNTMIRGNFRLLKVRRNTTRPLAGAEITVYKADGTRIDAKTTGVDGYAVFENLPYGEYYFIETKAPSGYVRNSERQYFTIEEQGVTVDRIFENRLIPTDGPDDPEDPDDPDDPDEPNIPDEPEDPDTPDTPGPQEPEAEINPQLPEGGVDAMDNIDQTEEDKILEINDKTPQGNIPTLPKTGELNPILFYIAGAMMIGLGVVLRRRLVRDR